MSLADWIQLRKKKSVNFEDQQKLTRMKVWEKKPEQSSQELWDNVKQSNILVIEVAEGEEGRERTKKKYMKRSWLGMFLE